VRSDQERDVYVLWREWDLKSEGPPEGAIDEGELCPAPIEDLKKATAWAWDPVKGKWEQPETLFPGMTLLLHATAGKYTAAYGWSPDSKAPVTPVEAVPGEMEKADEDPRSWSKVEQSLETHTRQVVAAMQRLLPSLPGVAEHAADLERAARLHDWGKAHPVMQKTLHEGQEGPYAVLLAKSRKMGKHGRKYFRHELASALAMLAAGEPDLAAYLVATHHGKIRVVVRSMPGERVGERVRIRGIEEGDRLLPCELGDGIERPDTELTLTRSRLGFSADGAASWTERVLRLRDDLGPFRLAYLEMVLRSADEAASAHAEKEATA
jgi:CRISPR-associated endonuclease/helicase Cas3